MITRGGKRRGVEDLLQEGLDATAQGGTAQEFLETHAPEALELAPLLQLAAQMRRTLAVEPRSDAKAAARYRVLAHAGQRPKSLFERLTLSFGLSRVVAVLALSLLLLVAGSTSAVVASASALPGEPLYSVKTTWEQLQIALTFDEAAKTAAYTDLAARRTQEVEELNNRGRPVPPETVQALAAQTAAAVMGMEKRQDAEALGQRLLELTQRQQEVLQEAAARAPDAARPALQHALEVSREGHQRAQEALERSQEGKLPASPGKRDAEERRRGQAVTPTAVAGREEDKQRGGDGREEKDVPAAVPERQRQAEPPQRPRDREQREEGRREPRVTPTPGASLEPTQRPVAQEQRGTGQRELRATPTPKVSPEPTGHPREGERGRGSLHSFTTELNPTAASRRLHHPV